MSTTQISRALLSVSDKMGLEAFARGLAERGVELLSTGGTRRLLEEQGVPVNDVAGYTGFPEMMDGRVKTLHPKIHGGILALRDNDEHRAAMEAHGIQPIDLVCVNLYPFEATVARAGVTLADAIENIDIGGPSMVRSAAKNHQFVTLVTSPDQYADVLADMDAHDGATSATLRRKLALAAFRRTAQYDQAIANYLGGLDDEGLFPEVLTLHLQKLAPLRYGENPHQQAALYAGGPINEPSLAQARLLGGKEMSFNNYLDAHAGLELVKEFVNPAAIVVKHGNPCGAATGADLVQAYIRAYLGDPVAAMGGILAFNRLVTEVLADEIVESFQRHGKAAGAGGWFAEVIIAPAFEPAAIERIRTGRKWGENVRLLQVGEFQTQRDVAAHDLKKLAGGYLVQSRDLTALNEADWKVVTERSPDDSEWDNLRLAWIVGKHVKSNAIVLAKDGAIAGVGAGQMSRIESSALAIRLAGARARGSACASDAFFPFADSIEQLANAGVTAVIQPGGSKRDEQVIAKATALGLAMVLTGQRHFRH